ncbi:uncharacterized protein LOC109859723 [Pseudomyrmex gracilis]|uniref:uncharacterized protein LOC109859723 n=1 Tax=Pseudomyrmex gracilis TaxID=219809 RepID=UPI000994B136|nr:uncharacterized protein LOC109859723 [Pseudomyrmex gracilis]
MYNSCEEDDVLQCPYNKYHFISLLRFSRHLVKCEKNYPNNLKVICPYDATHRLDKIDIGQHIRHCPARTTVEAYFFPLNNHNKNDTKLEEEHSSGTENNVDEDVSEDLGDPENSLSYALENALSLEKDKRLVDNLQDDQSKFKSMTAFESLSNKEKEEIHDRKIRQRMSDYSGFLDDESIISREVSMVGRRAIGRGISDYFDGAIDGSVGEEESLVGLRAIGRGRPTSSHAERLVRFRMKGGKTGGKLPKIV